MREKPSFYFTPVGRSFFPFDCQGRPLGEGCEVQFGFYSSVTHSEWKVMLVNIDGKQDDDFNKCVYIAARAVLIKGQRRDKADFSQLLYLMENLALESKQKYVEHLYCSDTCTLLSNTNHNVSFFFEIFDDRYFSHIPGQVYVHIHRLLHFNSCGKLLLKKHLKSIES